MTMKIRIALSLITVLALTAGFSLLINGQAHADDELEVTGSYDTLFTQFDVLGADDGFLILSNEIAGPFELTIGGVPRTGTLTFPHIARFSPVILAGTIHGGAAWLFDGGPTCVGPYGGMIVAGLFHGEGELQCSDGTTLSLESVDTDVAPGPGGHARADITGELQTNDDDDDDDDD